MIAALTVPQTGAARTQRPLQVRSPAKSAEMLSAVARGPGHRARASGQAANADRAG